MAIAQDVLERLPLAQAVLLVWHYAADEAFLERIFDTHRGRSYTKCLSFSHMVQLIGDALFQQDSARHTFETAQQAGDLPASIQAAYAKLRRIPITLSMAFFNHCAERIAELCPADANRSVAPCLSGMEVFVLDGKTVKWVHKRLKVLRQAPGGAVGGKALVALSINRGLVVALHAHPDGDANEVRFVGDLLPPLRQRLAGPRLFVADCAFCDLKQADRFTQEQDHFLLRHHPHVKFQRDATIRQRQGADAAGRTFVEAWGFLGINSDPQHVAVRQIVLDRPGQKPLILLTDLTDPNAYPARELLETYRNRWDIERVFQQITEVFGLARLIGTSAEATIFQPTFCLLIYNVIQVLRATLAKARQLAGETISTEKLFVDVKKQLQVWTFWVPAPQTLATLVAPANLPQLRERLTKVLANCWTDIWLKAPPQRRKPPPPRPAKRAHVSVFRLTQTAQTKSTIRKRSQ